MTKKVYEVKDIDDYQERLTDKQTEVLIDLCNEYGVYPEICAWYDDMEDFYQDWIYDNNIFKTKEEANDRYHDGLDAGEFVQFENGEIIRLSV